MNVREGKQKEYKNREGDKTEETHRYGEQTGLLVGLWEGGWAKWVRGPRESTPEIITALYANLDEINKLIN